MRKLLLALTVCGACVPMAAAPKSEGIRSTIDVAPKTPPALAGGYEFDLLDAVEGTACVGVGDADVYTATIPGFEPTQGSLLDQRAEGAALYDAMGKAQGADTLLVTWVKIIAAEGGKKCATVHARGVRLRQARPADATAPAAPAPTPPAAAPSETKPSTAAAAAPSS